MQISAVNPVNLSNVTKGYVKNVRNSEKAPTVSGVSYISFKGGNKEQALMFGVEVPPYNKAGGVATVMQDFRALRISDKDPFVTNQMKNSFDFYKQKNKVLVDPVYNGFISYDKNGIIKSVEVPRIPTGLPADSPLKKYEGRYFQTTCDNFQQYSSVEEFFKKENPQIATVVDDGVKGNIFILDDVTGGTKKLDFGGLEDSETKLFRVQLLSDGKLKNTNDFKVYTDLTSSLPSPYEKGGYSTVPGKLNQTWKGVADAKASKAFIEFMPRICELASEDGVKFDPATLVLNDSQAGNATEYMAQMAAKGDEFWQGKKAIFIGHNLGDGYIQGTSNMNMFVNIADKELRNAVYNSKEFTEAAKEGGDAVESFFKKYLPQECFDTQGGVSPLKNTLYWADKGLVPGVVPVSELYGEVIASDPEFAPGIYKYAKELQAKGVWGGILNAFENVDFDPTTDQGPVGYMKKSFDVEVDGKNVKIEPLTLYNAEEIKPGQVNVDHVREIKRQNKLKVLSRFDKKMLDALSKYREVPGKEKMYNEVILGLAKKEAQVYGHISEDILKEAASPTSRVKMLAAWGRSDAQKAMDSVLRSFIDYIKENPDDKYSVLFVGGPNSDESEKCINIVKQYSKDSDVAGRVVFIDGFLPNKPFASAADFTVFPSRFAPCELTDLESVKMFASPIVTNIQGLGQKNFDASFEGELEKVTGYKTKHAYTLHLDEMKPLLNAEENKELDKAVKKFRDGIKQGIHAANVTEDMITDKILKDKSLNYDYNFRVLRPFRDKIVERELTNCFKRALIEDNGKPIQDRILQNLRTMKTDWENNGGLKADGISSAEKYRRLFQRDPSKINESDTLLYKLRDKCKYILEEYRNGEHLTENGGKSGSKDGIWQRLKNWTHTKGGKWTAGIAGGAAIVGAVGYAGYKAGWLSPRFVEKKPHGHLSQIV